MKLSLIVPIYKQKKHLPKFLEKMTKQTSNEYEIIFVVDTENDNVISIIDFYKNQLKGKIRVIFNTKRSGRRFAVTSAIRIAQGDYSLILSVTNSFENTMIEKVNEVCKEKGTDIIEFRSRIKTPIKTTGMLRKNFGKPVDLTKDHTPLAYCYLFKFNKIFKTEILKKVIKIPKINPQVNSRFSVELLLKILIIAKTYSTKNIKIIRLKVSKDSDINTLSLFRQWNKILQQEIFEPYIEALRYNQYHFFSLLLLGMVGTSRNKNLISKTKKYIDKEFSTSFFGANKYYISINKETKILKSYQNKKSIKAYKEI